MTVTIMAEVGSNFEPGNLASALDMVHAAADVGANLVKFQDWNPIEQMNRTDEWKERAGPWTLPVEWHASLRRVADGREIGYICSVFTKEALGRALRMNAITFAGDRLYPQRCTAIKLASSELINQELLIDLAHRAPWMLDDGRPHPPIHFSIGEATHPNQVHTAIAHLIKYEKVLMACVAEYPVERALDLFDSLIFAQTFGLPVGVSSHLTYKDALKSLPQLVRRGATVVEMHLRTKNTPEDTPDNGLWSLFPEEFEEVVRAIKDV